jgi:hypothetical protein
MLLFRWAPMDGWNFLDSPPERKRNELRRCPQVEREKESAMPKFEELRAVVNKVLRGFPEAHAAVIERLTAMVEGRECYG